VKRLYIILLAVIIYQISLDLKNCEAQWVQTNGPNCGYVHFIVSDGNNLYSGVYEYSVGGLYRSTNNGSNWYLIGFSDTIVYNVAVSGAKVLATTNKGIFMSTNYGESWNKISVEQWEVNSIQFYNEYIFLCTNVGLLRSSNNGNNWTLLISDMINSININGSNIFAGSGTENGIYRSSDNGNTWINLFHYNYVSSIVSKDMNIYASTFSHGIYLSTNNGDNWSRINNGLSDTLITSMYVNGNNIYAGTSNGRVFLSTNNGYIWTLCLNSSYVYPKEITSFSSQNGYIFAGTGGDGIFRTSNNGTNWILIGLPVSIVYSIIYESNRLYTIGWNSKLFESTDYGDNWKAYDFATGYLYCVDAKNEKIFVGGGGIFRSTNGGANWVKCNFNYNTYAISIVGSRVLAGTGGIYYSTNNGNNWISTDCNQSIYGFCFNSSYIFARTSNGIYRSSNNGDNWISVNNGLANLTINTVITYNNNVYVGTDGNGIFISTNNGGSWNQYGLANKEINSIFFYGNNMIANSNDGIYITTNNGNSWIIKNQGYIHNSYPRSLLITNNYIYAGTDGYSIWRRPLSDIIGIQNISTEIPSSYSLSQNYPNPFNPTTIIKYQITKNNLVTLKIFDIMGREVETLVKEKQSPGTYEVNWNARHGGSSTQLPSGVYFYKINAGDFSETKKMILMK
jgi:photosystem II stability/assembly factor-like uncharacterized protein